MAVQAGPRREIRRGWRLAVLLASSTLIAFHPISSMAQAPTSSVTAQDIEFAIPAQPLASAIKLFIRTTGWQVGYPSALVDGLQSRAVSGRLSPQAALATMLVGTGLSLQVTGPETATLVGDGSESSSTEEDGFVLNPIIVKGVTKGVRLGSDSIADTGTTTISGGQIEARSIGNDANDILRDMPNVQYQNDIDDDAGITDQSVIDLKPREVRISGARVYENNFILDGMPINTLTGTAESANKELEDSYTPPDQDQIFGLHSQSVYVPTDFVESATVIDSNASASYGNFQGGVVSYKLREAANDRWHGSVSTDFTTSDWAGYHIGTEDGLNPNNVQRQDYLKRRTAYEITGPITDNIAVLGQYSTQSASTTKDKYYRYIETDSVPEDSKNKFYRAQVKAETDLGDFTLEGAYTDYDQVWENAGWRNMQVNQAARGLTSKLEHNYDFADSSIGGVEFSNIKLNSKLTYGSSRSLNDVNGNIGRAYKQSVVKSKVVTWEATELSDWCRTDPSVTISTICYDGATGDKDQGQNQLSWSQELTADVWQGSLKLGASYTYTDAYRRRSEDAIYYGVYTTLGDVTGISAFNCNTQDECSNEMFASNKAVYKAYNIHAYLNEFSTYGELEQTWDWFNIRAGARLSYDDYMKNLDISPRIVATITPWDDFSISVGANRYYNAQSLAYAIRDQRPRSQSYTRTQTSGTVNDWTMAAVTGNLGDSASGLNTPYTDELAFSISGVESLFDGEWRIRFLDRRSKDQYASTKTGNNYALSNDGTGAYQSISAEYSKDLETPDIAGLENLRFNASATWSRSEVSNDSYFEDSLEDDYIWYKGKSYTRAGFSVVTGNMDIPIRLQAGLSSSWLEDALTVDVAASYNLGYTGAKYTDENITVDGKNHEIYEDLDFDAFVTFNLSASYQVYKSDMAGLSLNVRVDNLFDNLGNATASTTNPWLIGRTVWVGAKATF